MGTVWKLLSHGAKNGSYNESLGGRRNLEVFGEDTLTGLIVHPLLSPSYTTTRASGIVALVKYLSCSLRLLCCLSLPRISSLPCSVPYLSICSGRRRCIHFQPCRRRRRRPSCSPTSHLLPRPTLSCARAAVTTPTLYSSPILTLLTRPRLTRRSVQPLTLVTTLPPLVVTALNITSALASYIPPLLRHISRTSYTSLAYWRKASRDIHALSVAHLVHVQNRYLHGTQHRISVFGHSLRRPY